MSIKFEFNLSHIIKHLGYARLIIQLLLNLFNKFLKESKYPILKTISILSRESNFNFKFIDSIFSSV